jgi:hypothetical protein
MYESQGSNRMEGRNQSRQQGNESRRAGESAINIADIALRGTAVLFSIQLDAVRSLFEIQARSAAAFGVPDYSGLFRSTDGGATRLLAISTDQMLRSRRQINDNQDSNSKKSPRFAGRFFCGTRGPTSTSGLRRSSQAR